MKAACTYCGRAGCTTCDITARKIRAIYGGEKAMLKPHRHTEEPMREAIGRAIRGPVVHRPTRMERALALTLGAIGLGVMGIMGWLVVSALMAIGVF